MCGIVGYSSVSGFSVDRSSLIESKAQILHRGPDDSGLFEDINSGVGLAHSRLSILDLSRAGNQPMTDVGSRCVLVYNGEIYNYRELRIELEGSGHLFNGSSDTEVLLQLYNVYRKLDNGIPLMLNRLNGIFAFAIWDAEKEAILLARDALGVKPLYYHQNQSAFTFASEIKALVPMVPTLGELDADSIHRYLTFLWCPGEGTPTKLVKKLNPGEALWIKEGRIEERIEWYSLPVFKPTKKISDKKLLIKSTTNHLRTAVHRQMVSDVPLGAFLSGGLDSSSVVAFAREVNPNIHCFTIESKKGQEEGVTDDLPYAKEVASHLKVPLEIVTIDSTKMAMDLEMMVATLDEPLADPAPLNVLYISRLARESGMKVLLSGAGGDDLFTGYRRHYAIELEKYWSWLPQPLRASIDRYSQSLDSRKPFQRRVSKLFSGAGLKSDERLIHYFKWSLREDLMPLYTADFKASLSDIDASKPMVEFLNKLPDKLTPLERMLALEQRFFLTDHNLTYTDKMSMAVGLEVRVPFLDLELVEFANKIPIHYKQHGSTGKWVLKKAMERYLPHHVIYRPKTGFGAPLRRWLRYELKELMHDILSESSLKSRGIFEPEAVQNLISKNDKGVVDASYTLLSLLCIELWCRRFLVTDSKADKN